ncbi:MAG: hypothetical protein JXA33_01720 [Anaerolineae bacterium]|nr:hypothetical protein [Anaerolineae bacterium]
MIFAHAQAGQRPLLVVGVDDLGLVKFPMALVRAPVRQPFFGFHALRRVIVGHGAAVVRESLHHPHHTHLMAGAPAFGVLLVEHARAKGHSAIANLVGDDAEGEVGHQGALQVLLAHRDAVLLHGRHVNHLIGVRAVHDVAHIRADFGVAAAEDDGRRAVCQRGEFGIGERPGSAVRHPGETVQHQRRSVGLAGDEGRAGQFFQF